MTAKEIDQSITNYLTQGGLFNPELMEHEKVRQLLFDIRASLPNILVEHVKNGMRKAAILLVDCSPCEVCNECGRCEQNRAMAERINSLAENFSL